MEFTFYFIYFMNELIPKKNTFNLDPMFCFYRFWIILVALLWHRGIGWDPGRSREAPHIGLIFWKYIIILAYTCNLGVSKPWYSSLESIKSCATQSKSLVECKESHLKFLFEILKLVSSRRVYQKALVVHSETKLYGV